jgi:hypothetical protein
MNKLYFLLVFFPVLLLSTEVIEEDLVGVWHCLDGEEHGYMTFDSAGYFTLQFKGLKAGGKEFETEGEKAQVTYKLIGDFDPMHLDITITKLESGEEIVLKSIIKFINSDSLVIAVGSKRRRPSSFDNKSEALRFSRVNRLNNQEYLVPKN